MSIKTYNKEKNVLVAARERISYAFDNFEKITLSFSGGKDSSVMFHLVMDEARKRNRIVTIMLVDFVAQYKATSDHAANGTEIDSVHRSIPLSIRCDTGSAFLVPPQLRS